MVNYKVLIKNSAEKELRSLPRVDLRRIVKRLTRLSINSRPVGSEKLSSQNRYRIRQGDWRIIYSVNDRKKEVTIFRIGHRREVYRND